MGNHARAMESLGASIEAEQRAKGEGLRIKKQLEGEINELEIGLDHANKANSEGLSPSSATRLSSVRPSRASRMRLAPEPRLLSRLASLSVRLLLSLERLKSPRHFLMEPTVPSDSSRMTFLTSVSLSPPSTPSRLRLMVCLSLPRMLRARPRRLWLMLLVLLMSSVLNRNMLELLELARTLSPMPLENLRDVSLTPRMLP